MDGLRRKYVFESTSRDGERFDAKWTVWEPRRRRSGLADFRRHPGKSSVPEAVKLFFNFLAHGCEYLPKKKGTGRGRIRNGRTAVMEFRLPRQAARRLADYTVAAADFLLGELAKYEQGEPHRRVFDAEVLAEFDRSDLDLAKEAAARRGFALAPDTDNPNDYGVKHRRLWANDYEFIGVNRGGYRHSTKWDPPPPSGDLLVTRWTTPEPVSEFLNVLRYGVPDAWPAFAAGHAAGAGEVWSGEHRIMQIDVGALYGRLDQCRMQFFAALLDAMARYERDSAHRRRFEAGDLREMLAWTDWDLACELLKAARRAA